MVTKKLLRNPISMLGLIILLGFVILAVFAPWIAPTPERYKDEPYRIPRYGYRATPTPPSSEHPFGLTQGQHDIFYGIVWGTRTAFRVGILVAGISCLIGVVVGSISAYVGGRVDEFLMRVVDIFMSFPFIIAAIVVTSVFGKSLTNVMVALIFFSWMNYARLIRGNILQVKQEEYVMAARASGVSHFKIILRHLLPNSIFPVLIQASMSLGSVVLTVAGLSFLGLGAEPGYADWGQMLSFARNWLMGTPGNPLAYWYVVAYPAAAIVLFVLAWNLIGDAFRDILDPRIQA
ncbi:MAG TPA: ABC transporter permease [Firmicutes bacterium]|nr:ABC transporter permease [Bacillota bacterium]